MSSYKRATLRVAVAVWCALLQMISASAQVEPALSDNELIGRSDIIVTGRVRDVAAGLDDRMPYTYVTVDVGDVLKGWVPERQIILKQLAPDPGAFVNGEEVLLFLHARAGDRTLTTTALSQGRWTIRRDHPWGQAVAMRQAGGDAYLLGNFSDRIRRAAAASPSPRDIIVSPREARGAVAAVGEPPVNAARGNSTATSIASSGTAVDRPGPPTSLRVLSGASTIVNWVAPTTGAAPTGYIIEAGSAPGLSDGGIFPVGPTTQFSSAGAVPLAFTYVRVRGTNAAGAGPASNEFAFYPDNFGRMPPAPTSLVPSISGSTVVLNWLPPPPFGSFSGPPSYFIEAGSAPGLSDIAQLLTFSARYTATGVGPGIYYVRVRAFTDVRGIPSNEVIVAVGRPAPCYAAPASAASFAATVSGSAVSLAWTASVGPVDSYIVEYGQAVAAWSGLDTASTATGLQVPGVQAGTYFVRVRGRNLCGLGAPSNEVVLTVG